ncbi:hypothetical protein DTL42_02695 [Bremerella cremea]|uniref:FecR protein domain-containing protein n=1 Tax=Bremerella cremea TaxID=1031537 RepID=A0A368KWR3_9BACT|nr:FecR domain-containing protein [Bremerella cremea]RCS54077.1 hypothetical protein DTL42_02695 [Bremerella cremea]
MSEQQDVVGKQIEDPEILKLVDLCITDRATPEQWQTLSDLIVQRKDVSQYFAAQALINARLAMVSKFDADQERELLKRIEQDDLLEPASLAAPPVLQVRRVVAAVSLVTAAALLLFGGLAISVWYQSYTTPGPAVASSGPVPPAVLISGIPGESEARAYFGQEIINLPKGIYQGVTSSGVKVELAGPVRIRINKPMSWRLFYGKVVADVPPTSHGFTVNTHNASVVDLGTKFGVAVDANNFTEVVVYQGSVELRTGSTLQRMVQGDAFEVPIGGKLVKIAANNVATFLKPGEIPPSVISEVRSNSPHNEKPYQIVRGGFREGALAYVDRVHQWSGISDSLPSSLIDLDYVQMVGDWKYNAKWQKRSDLELTVVFNRPTVAYLLVDERLPTPSWLTQHFSDTGISVGMDKGSHQDSRSLANYKLSQEEGPGKSIDVILRVWKAVLPEGGDLTIGPIGSRSTDWEVPCLVARPI